MIDFEKFSQDIHKSQVAVWKDFLLDKVEKRYQSYTHGDVEKWADLINNLPNVDDCISEIKSSVGVTTTTEFSNSIRKKFVENLMQLHPWRKGPFNLLNVNIDTEWRSDLKWDRIKAYIAPLKNRSVLDVGCGNGYHCWRMLGENARFVLGIDPSQKFLAQFAVLQKYLNQPNCHMLPIGIEDMPEDMGKNGFDSVFCMGVLCHRKSPINLLFQLKNLLNKGGELILETLVIDGDQNSVLVPTGRYAQMRNVWFLPSTKALELWLTKSGFSNVRTVDINKTTVNEQRPTDWMNFHSLEDFLDPNDNSKTIEGYPAPVRATLIANKK